MWVLMYIFSYSVSPAATNDRAEWRLLPTVVFQDGQALARNMTGNVRKPSPLSSCKCVSTSNLRTVRAGPPGAGRTL